MFETVLQNIAPTCCNAEETNNAIIRNRANCTAYVKRIYFLLAADLEAAGLLYTSGFLVEEGLFTTCLVGVTCVVGTLLEVAGPTC